MHFITSALRGSLADASDAIASAPRIDAVLSLMDVDFNAGEHHATIAVADRPSCRRRRCAPRPAHRPPFARRPQGARALPNGISRSRLSLPATCTTRRVDLVEALSSVCAPGASGAASAAGRLAVPRIRGGAGGRRRLSANENRSAVAARAHHAAIGPRPQPPLPDRTASNCATRLRPGSASAATRSSSATVLRDLDSSPAARWRRRRSDRRHASFCPTLGDPAQPRPGRRRAAAPGLQPRPVAMAARVTERTRLVFLGTRTTRPVQPWAAANSTPFSPRCRRRSPCSSTKPIASTSTRRCRDAVACVRAAGR